MRPDGADGLGLAPIDVAAIDHLGHGEQRVDARQGVVGAVQQAMMPVVALEHGIERRSDAVQLGHCRDVAEEQMFVARLVHHSGKQREVGAPACTGAGVEILAVAHRCAMGDDDAHAVLERAAQTQRIAQALRIGDVHGALEAGMTEERHVQTHERLVERVAAWRCRIDVHGRRQPFDCAGAIAHCALEGADGVFPVRVHGGRPFELSRVASRYGGGIVVRHVKMAFAEQALTVFVVGVVEGEQHEPRSGREAREIGEQARDIVVVDLVRTVHARCVEKKIVLAEKNGVDCAAHVGIDPGTAAVVADAEQVHVTIPSEPGIDAVPGCGNEAVVVEERTRERRLETGVEETVLRPEVPAAGGGCAQRAQEQAAFHACSREMSAVSRNRLLMFRKSASRFFRTCSSSSMTLTLSKKSSTLSRSPARLVMALV